MNRCREIFLEEIPELFFDLRLQESLNGCKAIKRGADQDRFERVVFEDEGDAFDLIHNKNDDSTQFEVADPEGHGDDKWLVSCQNATPGIGWIVSLFDVHRVGLNFGLKNNVGIAVVCELENASEALHGQLAHFKHLEFRGQSSHVEFLDGDMVDDDGRFVTLVESIGEHGLCLVDEFIREVGPLESEGHGESVARERRRLLKSCGVWMFRLWDQPESVAGWLRRRRSK